jgi:hypothetical protein
MRKRESACDIFTANSPRSACWALPLSFNKGSQHIAEGVHVIPVLPFVNSLSNCLKFVVNAGGCGALNAVSVRLEKKPPNVLTFLLVWESAREPASLIAEVVEALTEVCTASL